MEMEMDNTASRLDCESFINRPSAVRQHHEHHYFHWEKRRLGHCISIISFDTN